MTIVAPETKTAAARSAPDAVAACAAELIACGSIEMSAHLAADAQTLGSLLPAGTKVYVNHLPRHTLADTFAALQAVHGAGLEPVPHVAARRVATLKELETFLVRAVRQAGVRKVLLIRGDDPRWLGAFEDSTGLLKTGALAACGVRRARSRAGGLPGGPRAHRARGARPRDERKTRDRARAGTRRVRLHPVLIRTGAGHRILHLLARNAPGVPVYVGLAGPADPARLLRFAQRCGVSASLRALHAQGMGLVRLVTHTDPGEQLTAVARYCAAHDDCNVVGVHLFSFGGAAKTAEWMNSQIARQRAA